MSDSQKRDPVKHYIGTKNPHKLKEWEKSTNPYGICWSHEPRSPQSDRPTRVSNMLMRSYLVDDTVQG